MDSRHRGAFASRCRRACAHARWRVPCGMVLLRTACSMHRGCVRPAGSQVASARKAAADGAWVRCRYSCDRIEATAQPKDGFHSQPVAMFWACPACPWGPGASVRNRRGTGRASRSAKGTALQVMLTMCRLGMACDSCTMRSCSAADSVRTLSLCNAWPHRLDHACPFVCERASAEGNPGAGHRPASANRAHMRMRHSCGCGDVSATRCPRCVPCWSTLLRRLEVPCTTEPRAHTSVGFITASRRSGESHRSGNH